MGTAQVAAGLIALAAAAPLAGQAPSAGTTIFFFVDEDGVAHYSNHPTDPRYRPWNAAATAATSGTPGPVSPPPRTSGESRSDGPGPSQRLPDADDDDEPDAMAAESGSSHH